MAPPTAGIRLKILRALDDLNTLSSEGRKYLDSEPNGVRFEFYEEQGERRCRALLVIREPAPLPLGVLAGEAAYHLRGALDHLVYQLALLNVPEPSGTQFPLALDERIYRTVPPGQKRSPRNSMLNGVREEHRAIIDEFQPYHDGPRAEVNPLYVVHKFANADKHRSIQAAFGRPDRIKVEPWEDGIELDVRFPELKPPINEGTELFNVRVVEGYPDVPMRYSVRFTLAYGTGRPDYVSRMYLVEAGERIHDIITEVERRAPRCSSDSIIDRTSVRLKWSHYLAWRSPGRSPSSRGWRPPAPFSSPWPSSSPIGSGSWPRFKPPYGRYPARRPMRWGLRSDAATRLTAGRGCRERRVAANDSA